MICLTKLAFVSLILCEFREALLKVLSWYPFCLIKIFNLFAYKNDFHYPICHCLIHLHFTGLKQTHKHFPGSSDGKNPPVMQETQVCFLGQEDPIEKGMITHSSSCLENFMDRGAWWATVHGWQRVGHK